VVLDFFSGIGVKAKVAVRTATPYLPLVIARPVASRRVCLSGLIANLAALSENELEGEYSVSFYYTHSFESPPLARWLALSLLLLFIIAMSHPFHLHYYVDLGNS
jgi:hypothetical protein